MQPFPGINARSRGLRIVRTTAWIAPAVVLTLGACTTNTGTGSGGYYGGGSSSGSSGTPAQSSGGTNGGGIPGNDTSVCVTYDDDTANRPTCGIRGGGLDCGAQYSCTGICNQGPVCFARSNCCADSCSAFGGTKVCGTKGRLNDNNKTVVDCDKGFASRHSGGCETANPDWTCCSSTSPSFLCSPGSSCANLDGGGFCCTTAKGCVGYKGLCANGETCCNGLTCNNGYCQTGDFQCTPAGGKCVLGSTDCCSPLRCLSLGGGKDFMCVEYNRGSSGG